MITKPKVYILVCTVKSLTKTMKNQKVVDIDSGRWIVAADLHGNLEDYEQLKKIYNQKKSAGEIDGLILAGDTIHAYNCEDKSKEIIDDLISLTNEDSNVYVLLGNHELAHIHNFTFGAGHHEFTKDLELAIKDERAKYVEFFKSLPVYVRTKGGVTISHAGASKQANNIEDVINMNHEDIIQENKENFEQLSPEDKERFKILLEQNLYGMTYTEALKVFRGITLKDSEKDDSLLQGEFFHKSHLLKKHPDKEEQPNPDMAWLGDMLFNINESAYGHLGYLKVIEDFLKNVSEDCDPQNLIVSGHIHSKAGFAIFEDKNLRITSSAEIQDPAAKTLLIIDAKERYSSARDLANNLCSLHPESTDEELSKKVENLSTKYKIKTVYNITPKKIVNLHDILSPQNLARAEKELTKEKLVVEGGIKPKSMNLNQILLEITAGLEKNNVGIDEILTDGGSVYLVSYEDKSGNKGDIKITHDQVVDNHPVYGPLQIKKVDSGNGFAHVIYLDVPVGEKKLENGEKVMLVAKKPIPSTHEHTEKILDSVKSKIEVIPKEMLKELITEYVFKRSVLEEPYTTLSGEEFLKNFLEQKTQPTNA